MSLALTAEGALRSMTKTWRRQTGARQDTAIYFDPQFAELLETWATDSCWLEIRLLLAGRRGKVLDLACGTGRTWDFLRSEEGLEYFGCDISAPLIDRAIARGIAPGHLKVADATRLDYRDGQFDFLFSIGSLEHFSVDGLRSAIAECRRVCRGPSLHQVPVSRTGFDEGWITPYQSYWNNSERWWREQFAAAYGPDVWTMTSRWDDRQSVGRWFLCGKPG